MHTVDCICRALAETIARQLVFQASVVPNAVNIEGESRVGHWFKLRLYLARAVHGTDRPIEDRLLKLFWLLIHLHRLYTLGP
jgi:hypothetical protein